ncbi:hypothetical protein, partial [Burkholderia ubonensis]|uniref:hypothetical protein n=1 Tax=Burkholderia ubonensis TaxID=101571 RepID=UPI001C4348A4
RPEPPVGSDKPKVRTIGGALLDMDKWGKKKRSSGAGCTSVVSPSQPLCGGKPARRTDFLARRNEGVRLERDR